MAENVNANININVDTSDAVAELRLLQSQIATFNKALVTSNAAAMAAQKSMMGTMIAQIGATHQFSTSIANVETSVSRLGKSIDKNKLSLGEYFRYGIAASGKFGRMFRQQEEEITNLAVDRVKRLQTQYIALERAQGGMTKALAVRPLQLFNADTAIAIQKTQLFNKLLHDGSTSLINWGKNTQWAGRQLMVGFTVPLTIFGGMAGKIFMDLEKQVVKFRRVYGDATTPLEETDAMIGQIQELAKEYTKYGIAVTDTIALAGDAAAAGAQGESLIAATAQATRLGTLGMIDQQQALTATIALQSAFRMSNEELANSVNFLNAVENQTVVSLDDITQAIPLVAPVIQGLGGDVQDLAIFMAAMREGGVNASEGANALKSGLASLINPTKAAREQLQAVGINIDSILSKNKGDLRGIVTEFGAALGTLDKFQRQQVLAKMFGKYQFARLGALFDNINRSGSQAQRVMDLTSMSVEDLGALADKELSAISESIGVKFTAAVERFKLAIAPIGETFLRIATPIIDFATKIAEKFNELSPTAKQFTVILVTALGVVVPTLVMVTGLFANFFGQIIKGLATFKNFFSKLTGGSKALNYLSEEELDAAAASSTLEGRVDSLTGSLNVQRAAVNNLARAYSGYVGAAQAAAMNLPGGAIRTPRPRRMATGGFVAGKGNKDTEPALLTPGEFVVNKDAAQKFGPILGAMNAGTISQLAKGHKTHLTERMTFGGAAGALNFFGSESGFAGILNVILDIENAIGGTISKLAAVSNLVVDMPAEFNRAMMKNEQNAMTGGQFAGRFGGRGLEKWELTSRVAGENFQDLLPHLQILDDNIVRIGGQMDRVGDFNIDTVMRQAFDELPVESRRMLTNIENLSTQFNNLRITVMDLDRLTEEQKATLRALGYSWTREGNRVRVSMQGQEILSARTRQETTSVGPTYRNVSVRDTQSAAAGGVTLADAADDAARARMGAASPAMAGADLMHDYAAGMLVGARQSAAMAGQAGAILGGAAGAGVMGGGIPGQPITQSGMTFLPSPMGLFLPEGAGDGPDKPVDGPDKPADDDKDTTKKIDDVGKAADDTDKRVGKLGKTLGSVGKGFGIFGMIASVATGGLMMMDGKVGEIAQSLFPLISLLDVGFIAMSMFSSGGAGAAGALGGIGAAAGAAAVPLGIILAIIAAIVLAIANFVAMYKKFGFFKDAVDDLGQSFVELAQTYIGPQIEFISENMETIVGVGKSIGNAFYKVWEIMSLFFTVVVKGITMIVKIFTMVIGLITMARMKIVQFIQNSKQIQAVFSKIGEVFSQFAAIFSKAFEDAKRQFADFVNQGIALFNQLIEMYNSMAKTMGMPIIVPIQYVITGDKGLTSPQVAGAVKEVEDQQRSKDAEAARYQAMADAYKKPPPEEDLPTGGAGGPQLTWLQEMMKEWEANSQLFLGKMKNFNTSFFGLVQQLRTGVRAGGKRMTPLPIEIIQMIGAGPEGVARAQQLLNLSGKKLKNAIKAWRNSFVGQGVETLRVQKEQMQQQQKAQAMLMQQGFGADQAKEIAGDEGMAALIVQSAAKGKKAYKEVIDLIREVNQESTDFASEMEKLMSIMQMEFELRPDIRGHKEMIKIYEKQIELIQEKINKIEEANEADRQAIRGLERQKEMLQRRISALERLNELDQRRIDALKREDEIRNRVSSALSHDLEIMSQQEQKIKEAYDKRVAALNQVTRLNDRILQQQRGQLQLAQALNQGDIYAATAQAQEMQAQEAGFAQEQMGMALQQGMENQVAGLTTQGGLTRQQAEAQIASIKEQSYQTGLKIQEIEDKIYQRNLDMLPIKDAIYNLDLAIQTVSDRIFDRETEILNIKNNELDPITKKLQAEQKILRNKEDEFQAIMDAYKLQVDQYKLAAAMGNLSEDLKNTWWGIADAIAEANRVMKQQLEAASAARPSRKNYETNADYEAALAAHEALKAEIIRRRDERVGELMGKGANATKNVYEPLKGAGGKPANENYAGGYIRRNYASGSYVMGDGGRDSVSAMLTPGEFIVRKAMVKKYGIPMLQSINQGAFNLPKYASAPQMSSIRGRSREMMPHQSNLYNSNNSVNVYVSGTNASADEIANKAIMKLQELQTRRVRSNRAY